MPETGTEETPAETLYESSCPRFDDLYGNRTILSHVSILYQLYHVLTISNTWP